MSLGLVLVIGIFGDVGTIVVGTIVVGKLLLGVINGGVLIIPPDGFGKVAGGSIEPGIGEVLLIVSGGTLTNGCCCC